MEAVFPETIVMTVISLSIREVVRPEKNYE